MRRPSALLLDSLNDVAIYSARGERGAFRQVPNAPGAVRRAGTGATPTSFEAFPQYHRGYPSVDRSS